MEVFRLSVYIIFLILIKTSATERASDIEKKKLKDLNGNYCHHTIITRKPPNFTGQCDNVSVVKNYYRMQLQVNELKQQRRLQKQIERVLTLENGILREREEWMNKISKLEKKVAELTKVNLENENERLNCSQMVLSEKSILYREQRIWDNKVNQLRESLESERAKHSADILHLQEKALKLENEKLNISAEMMQLGYQMLIANERIAQVETTNVQTASELQHQAANLAQCETQLANVWSQLRNETEMNRILQQKLQNEHDSQSKVRVKYLKQTMGDQDTALEYNQNKNVDDTGNTLEDLGNYGYGEIQTNEISAVDGSQFELVKTDKLEFVVAQVVENKNKTDQILMDIADIENKLEMLPLTRIWANFDQMQNVLDNSTAQIDDLNTTLHSLAAFVHMKLGMNQSSLTGMLDQQTTQIENHVLNFTKYLHCLLPEKPKGKSYKFIKH